MRQTRLFFIGLMLVGALTGCGTATSSTSGVSGMQFVNKIGLDIGHVNPKFDAQVATLGLYSKVNVVTESGKKVTLDADKQPLLFEAYWCPHCQRTLVALNKNKDQLSKLPVLVSTGFAPGTTLEQATEITREEFTALGLKGFQVYYILDPFQSIKYVKHYPKMAFFHEKTLTLTGEHTFSVWQKALD